MNTSPASASRCEGPGRTLFRATVLVLLLFCLTSIPFGRRATLVPLWWLGLMPSAAQAQAAGDLDDDGQVCRNDLDFILVHRNQPAASCPLCDLDGDNRITVLDARKCVLLCTHARCQCMEPSGSRVTVDLPAGVDVASMTVQSPSGQSSVGQDGKATLTNPPQHPCLVAGTLNGNPVALCFFEPGKDTNSLSCLETAVSLVMLNSLLFAVPPGLISEVLAMVREVPEVQTLAIVISQELGYSSSALVDPSEDLKTALQNASQAAQVHVRNLVNAQQP